VSLAVRVKASSDDISEEEEAGEDNASIDEFVSRFRFEYVDATLEERECGDNDEFDGRPYSPPLIQSSNLLPW